MEPLFTNDAIVLGILLAILAFVFTTESSDKPFWKKFYKYIPGLLMCYFLPSVFNSLGIISGDVSNLYYISSRYLLPASLVLLTISIDLKAILNLGPKAIIMFITGTFGIVIGGPIALMVFASFFPDVVAGDDVWRGMTTVAGSWIGGGANQAAMKEVFEVGDEAFSALVAVDVIVANIWMAFLLYGAGNAERFDKWLGGDTSAIKAVRDNVEEYRASISKIPNLTDAVQVVAVGFGVTAVGHFGADLIAPFIENNFPVLERFSLTSKFFWLIVIATTGGLILSFTPVRRLEGVGASRMGSLLLYVLIASIGMKMNVLAIFDNPGLFFVGLLWMAIHATLMITVAKLIKAPLFFMAVGSQANVGGAASAPVVASAFHPALAPVGVLLAVLGYAVGTYGAWLCGITMRYLHGMAF